MFSRNNEYLANGVTLETYLNCSHVEVISPTSYHNASEILMREKLPERKVGLRVAHYSSVPSAIENTNMVVTVPSRIALSFAKHHALDFAVLPFEMADIDVRLFWADAFVAEPGLAWMKDKIITAISRF